MRPQQARLAAVALPIGFVGRLSFAPMSVPLVMVLSVAALFALLRRSAGGPQPHGTSAAVAAAWAAGFFGPLIWWLNAVDFWAWLLLTAAMVAAHALIGWALSHVIRRRGWPLWTALVWTAGETARGSWPLHGFPWGRLAYCVLDSPLESLVRLVSMPATTFILALVAALLVRALSSWRWAAGVSAAVAALVAAAVALPVGLAGPAGTDKTVAIVQSGIPGAFLTWPHGAIGMMTIAQTELLDQKVDMILWPENALDMDPIHNKALGRVLSSVSRQLGAPILVAGVFDGPTRTTALNTGIVWTADGPGQSYVKRRPVPFGEYVPYRSLFGKLLPTFNREIPRDVLPGDRVGALHIAGTVVGAQICWDVAFDDVIADNVRAGATFLVDQTSNAAFQGTDQLDQQWSISRLRAIETGRWVAVPSTSGITGLISPTGRVVARQPLLTPATIVHRVALASKVTPAVRYGQKLSLLINLAATLVLLIVLGPTMVRRSSSCWTRYRGAGAGDRSRRCAATRSAR